jgi:hypothetical protein
MERDTLFFLAFTEPKGRRQHALIKRKNFKKVESELFPG